MTLEQEIRANFETFSQNSSADAQKAAAALEAQKEQFAQSYSRITSLQAWRVEVLEKKISKGSLGFFLEAQNDALLSHLFARLGVWRSALQALRSVVENVLQALFYMDHSVELRLWDAGKHRLTFQELLTYFKDHPDLKGPAAGVAGLQTLQTEYATLSRAVHGSSAGFRMTAAGSGPKFFKADAPELGKWLSREKAVVTALNMLLIAVFRDDLAGTRALPLRRVLQLSLPASKKASAKATLGVVFPT